MGVSELTGKGGGGDLLVGVLLSLTDNEIFSRITQTVRVLFVPAKKHKSWGAWAAGGAGEKVSSTSPPPQKTEESKEGKNESQHTKTTPAQTT